MRAYALRPAIARRRARRRRPRPLDVDAELVSVAGALGADVFDPSGTRVASLHDLVVHWSGAERHPPLAGVVVRLGRSRRFVTAGDILELRPGSVLLRVPFVGAPVERGHCLVALAHDVLDRQIVDVDGTRVVRVSDLVLAETAGAMRLVGVDVSARTLLRRVWPRSLRYRVSRERVFDWASVAAFSQPGGGTPGGDLRLTQAADHLRERGPADLEALLEDLPLPHRAQLSDEVHRR